VALGFLLTGLLGWGNKPSYLIPMAYRWCSAISKKIRERRGDEPASEHVSSSGPFGDYARILSLSLAVGFRHIRYQYSQPTRLSDTPHDEWMLDTIFTRGDDDAIADAVCVEIVDIFATQFGSWYADLSSSQRGTGPCPRGCGGRFYTLFGNWGIMHCALLS
jgi:hypothetical protein